jgi:hypothetical protein
MAPELQYDTEKVKVHSLGRFGTIRYVDLPRGYIKIVNDFFQKNMIKVKLPFVGDRWIHKEMKEPLLAVLNHIVHVSQYDPEWEYIEHLSIYNPRHMWYRATKPLSRHAFGVAVDVNPWENLPGTDGVIPPHIVGCFKTKGFKWGGDFDKKKDPMHFELRT